MTPNDFREDGGAAASRTSTTAFRFRRIFGSATLHANWANLIPPSKYLAFPLIAVEAFVNNARADKAFWLIVANKPREWDAGRQQTHIAQLVHWTHMRRDMTRETALTFAAEWTAAWNELAVERVLDYFDENVSFTSPTARTVVGASTVLGKQALREYWNEAVAHIGSLRFVVDRVLWDPSTREMAIVYISEIGGRRKRVSEQLTFGPDGRVVSAEVFHGVDV